jgi:hypothetical protein
VRGAGLYVVGYIDFAGDTELASAGGLSTDLTTRSGFFAADAGSAAASAI